MIWLAVVCAEVNYVVQVVYFNAVDWTTVDYMAHDCAVFDCIKLILMS